jgi:hypothetical protein
LIQNSLENSTSSTGNFNKALQLQTDSESVFLKMLEQHLGQKEMRRFKI